MNTKEYEKLQARLTALQNKQERQPSSGKSWRDGWKDAILAVKSMVHSEFKAESPWIPVSERLPSTYKIVLVTYGGDGMRFTGVAYLNGNGDWNCYNHTDVIAWMPLPQPYEVNYDD